MTIHIIRTTLILMLIILASCQTPIQKAKRALFEVSYND